MIRMTSTAVLLVALAGTALAQPAQQPRLRVVNSTPDLVNIIQVSPSSSDDWGDDLLGRLQLAAGSAVFVNFAPGSECRQDVKVTFQGGAVRTTMAVDACAGTALVLEPAAR